MKHKLIFLFPSYIIKGFYIQGKKANFLLDDVNFSFKMHYSSQSNTERNKIIFFRNMIINNLHKNNIYLELLCLPCFSIFVFNKNQDL